MVGVNPAALARVLPATVRVRILVAIDRDGKWTALGAWSYTDDEMKDLIFTDNLDPGEVYHWIEANVPLPTEAGPAIGGTVSPA